MKEERSLDTAAKETGGQESQAGDGAVQTICQKFYNECDIVW